MGGGRKNWRASALCHRRAQSDRVDDPAADGQLWAVANERDEIGPDLVPDYLTTLKDGGFYGWPYSYWGQNVDPRAQPQDPAKVATAIRPDYSLGSHVAALGVSFSAPSMGAKFAEGVFVGEHGSWNRQTPAGYKVVFVPFSNGRPAGPPIDFVQGFMGDDGKNSRPTGWSYRGPARRAHCCRRPVEYGMACDRSPSIIR